MTTGNTARPADFRRPRSARPPLWAVWVFPRIDRVTASETTTRLVLPPWPGRMVSADGVTVFVRRAEPVRDGLPPALYVHGLGGSAQNWTDLMGALRDVVDGEAPDLPGFGQSPPPSHADYSVTAQARTVIRLLEASGRGPVHLFGNSLGGAVSTRVAALRPDLVRTLTLVSPALPHLRPSPVGSVMTLYSLPGFNQVITRWLTARSPEQRVQGMLDLVYTDSSQVPPQRRREAAEEYLRRDRLPYAQQAVVASLRGLIAAYLERGPSSLWRQAARVSAPTLLVYGRRDKLVDVRTSRRALATFPDARLVVLPHSGHVPMMEHPDIVERAFREFVAGVTGRSGGS